MNSVVIMMVVFALSGLLFSGTSGILPKSYASANNILTDNYLEFDKQGLLERVDNPKLMQSLQYLMDSLNEGVIDGEWLKANGLNEDLLEGADNNQLIEATQYVMDSLNNGEKIDRQWIEDSLDGYDGGGFVLILVLFILLVIIGAGFGGGYSTN